MPFGLKRDFSEAAAAGAYYLRNCNGRLPGLALPPGSLHQAAIRTVFRLVAETSAREKLLLLSSEDELYTAEAAG